MRLLDAQSAVTFLVAQAAHIEPTVYKMKYPDIRYPGLIPVDTSANPWTQSVIYYSTDQVGKAEWFKGSADDMPLADVTRAQFATGVRMAGIGYSYDLEELSYAQMLGVSLTSDKASAARRGSEEFIDQIALYGDAAVGFKGLINNDGVTAGDVPAGASTYKDWVRKTPDEMLADVNNGLTGIFTGSKEVEMADTLLLPTDRFTYINTRRLSDDSETTIMSWLKKNNIYTQETGAELTIRSLRGLETAGAGNTHRMVMYRRDPSVVKLHMPMPFRFWPVWQTGPMKFDVPGTFRLGGVDIKRPSAFRYYDAI